MSFTELKEETKVEILNMALKLLTIQSQREKSQFITEENLKNQLTENANFFMSFFRKTN